MTAARFDPPDADGFSLWRAPEEGRFLDSFGPLRVRAEGEERVRCRVTAGRGQSNIADAIHGGFILAYIDQAAFCAPLLLERLPLAGAVTLTASATFIGAGALDEPLDAVVEIVGETGRMMFLRGLVEQGDRRIATFEVTLRKVPARAGRVAARS